MSYFQNLNSSNIRQALLNMFFGGTKSVGGAQQMYGAQPMYGSQFGGYSGMYGCGVNGYMFDMPDQDIAFTGGWNDACGCGCNQPAVMPERGCTQRFSEQFSNNFNAGIVDGQGNDIYDGFGNDVYAYGNRGIIDTKGNDIYAQNVSYNMFNTVNNFIRTQPEPTTPTTPTQPTVDPPSPTVTPEGVSVNLTPLRNLLTGIEALQPDGVLSDTEMNKAMNNPHYADLDGDDNSVSSQEMAIFNKIKTLNEDKELITSVLKGDYSNLSDEQLTELGSISDSIRDLTRNR